MKQEVGRSGIEENNGKREERARRKKRLKEMVKQRKTWSGQEKGVEEEKMQLPYTNTPLECFCS